MKLNVHYRVHKSQLYPGATELSLHPPKILL
jgi:hypothetical protein